MTTNITSNHANYATEKGIEFLFNAKSPSEVTLIQDDVYEEQSKSVDDLVYETMFCRENDYVLEGVSSKLFDQRFAQYYDTLCTETAELAFHFHISTDTVILTMSTIDRVVIFLLDKLKRIKVRLLSCTCLLLACKMTEIYVSSSNLFYYFIVYYKC